MTWVVAGALAADRYRATPRYTADLDLLVSWDDALPAVTESLGYDVLVLADEGEPPHLLRLRNATERIDLLVDYQRLALARGAPAHVLTIEDVLVHKLISWRPKDRDDVEAILATAPELDEAYVEEWVAAWEVGDRWAAVRLQP